MTQINAALRSGLYRLTDIVSQISFHKGFRHYDVEASRMKAGAIMRIQPHAFLSRISAALLLLGALATSAARADETTDRLNHLNGIYEIECATAREARNQLSALDDWLLNWYRYRFFSGEMFPPKLFELFADKKSQHDSLQQISPSLDVVCNKARQTYEQALGEAIMTRWLEQLPTSADVAKPPTSANSPGAATDQQCSELSKKAGLTGAFGGLGDLADTLGNRANSRAHEIAGYRRALALYRQGAARCKQGRFPALFAKRIRETEQSLRKLGVVP